MPELPEVETTILGLKPLINCTVNNIKIYNHKLRYYIPKKIIKKHKDSKIINIVRLGKYILIYLSNTFIIVFHLGMSGRLRLLKNKKIDNDKHDHFKLFTDNNYSLVFNDPRKFGFIDFDKVHLIMNRNYILKFFIIMSSVRI